MNMPTNTSCPPAEGAEQLELIRASRELLGRLAENFRASKVQDPGSNDPLAHIIERGLRLGIEAHVAVLLLLKASLVAPAAIITRSAFELSARFLWAARAASGWQRLQSAWANDDRRWARKAEHHPELAHIAQGLINGAQMARATEAKVAPPLDRILEEIDAHDRQSGQPALVGWASFQYLVVYRYLSSATHMHARMLDMANSAPVAAHVRTTLAATTIQFARALAFTYGGDPSPTIDSLVALLKTGLPGKGRREGSPRRRGHDRSKAP